ncbi:TIGR03943 family putative permease subunit [Parvimonas sp. G1425]|uniref:TIGR03943 family putative permease subunit n=1 Tax=Parvimonas sp. G1425 TaxID=3387694 RepID=UPI0039E5787E
MNKKILSLVLSCLLLCSCSKSDSNKFVTNKENKNDLKSALKDDPENAGTDKDKKSTETDKNQNPDDYKIERHKNQDNSNNEYKQPEKKDELTKDQLNEKRDADSKDGIINISDGIFLALVNDIYVNKDEYIGKKVRISGQNVRFEDKDTGEVIYAILREGPGCCYNDSVIGFEYITDGKYPEKDKWYEMIGEVIVDKYKSGKVVKLKLIEIKEVEPKGKLIHFQN